MNGYLVIARCWQDDLPLALCSSLKEARDIALQQTLETIQEAAMNLQGDTVTDWVAIVVSKVENGVPLAFDTVAIPDSEGRSIPYIPLTIPEYEP